MKNPLRLVKHLFKSGVVYAGLDHFLAMFPATILVPYVINDKFNAPIDAPLIDVSLVLMASGLGTLLFLLITNGKIPAYLGSSFAYIGLTFYLVSSLSSEKGIPPYHAYSYVVWAYLFAAFLLVIFSIAHKFEATIKLMGFLFPTTIIGPAISLIGLELANVAAIHAGIGLPRENPLKFTSMSIAISTLGVIVLASIARRTHFRNASIVVGMIFGYLVSWYFGLTKPADITSIRILSVPRINLLHLLPPDIWQLFVAVIPATIVVFAEHIGRTTVINRMQYHYDCSQDTMEYFKSVQSSLRGHAASIAFSSLLGSVPTTLYAENIAVMSINSANLKHGECFYDPNSFIRKLYNPVYFIPYVIAAFIAIAVSFLNILQVMLNTIPRPVIGGMELFLFGIIAAPGIQLLVETGVNFRKLTNQILTASVLIAGISGFSLDFGIVELKGMSLGMAAGISMNLLFKALDTFGLLNESLTFPEILELCITDAPKQRKIANLCTRMSQDSAEHKSNGHLSDILAMESEDILRLLRWQNIRIHNSSINCDIIRSLLIYADNAEILDIKNQATVYVLRAADGIIHLRTRMSDDEGCALQNDHPECVNADKDGYVDIRLDGRISTRRIKQLLRYSFSAQPQTSGLSLSKQ